MENQSYSSVLIFRKLKTDADLIGAAEHNSRWKKPKNADPARFYDNKFPVGNDRSILDLVNARIKSCGIKPRKNAVLALEFIQSAGRDFFKNIKSEEDWVTAATDFLAKKFKRENVVHVSLHKDETTTHLHAIVVPIVEADDKDGRFRENHKQREWKLDAKGIFEKYAKNRELGKFDRSAATFCESDFTTSFKFIKKLVAKADPVSALLANKMNPDALASFSSRQIKLKDKRKILIAEMKKILGGPSLFDEPVFAQLALPPDTMELKNRYPTGDDLYCLNRRLIEAAYDGLIVRCEGRPIGNPTALYLHELQAQYFDLCQKMDPQISEPRYGAKMEHQKLSNFYAALEKGMQTGAQLADIQVKPTPFLKSADQHAAEETTRIKAALEPLVALAANAVVQQQELEESKAGILRLNRKHIQDKKDLVAENASLKAVTDALRHQMRLIPLDQVMVKLGFNQRVPGKENQFHLPDERIIEINGRSFTDLTSRYGLGQMNNRKGAKGAIDLTMFVTGWDLRLTQKWLKDNFNLGAALNESADRIKGELEPELAKTITADEAKAFTIQQRSPLHPDADQWIQVKQSLAVDYGLEPQLLDDLRRASLIDANKHGSLVCIKLNQRQFVGGMALGLKANPVAGTTSVYETPDDDGFPFVLGNPQSEYSAIVASPLEAIAFYQLCRRNCYVLATKLALPPAILDGLKKRNPDTSFPVLIAHDLSPEGNRLAGHMKVELDKAGVKNEPHRPPKFHDHATSWVDLALAVGGKLKKFVGISTEAVSEVVERCKNIFCIFTPSSISDSIKREK